MPFALENYEFSVIKQPSICRYKWFHRNQVVERQNQAEVK